MKKRKKWFVMDSNPLFIGQLNLMRRNCRNIQENHSAVLKIGSVAIKSLQRVCDKGNYLYRRKTPLFNWIYRSPESFWPKRKKYPSCFMSFRAKEIQPMRSRNVLILETVRVKNVDFQYLINGNTPTNLQLSLFFVLRTASDTRMLFHWLSLPFSFADLDWHLREKFSLNAHVSEPPDTRRHTFFQNIFQQIGAKVSATFFGAVVFPMNKLKKRTINYVARCFCPKIASFLPLKPQHLQKKSHFGLYCWAVCFVFVRLQKTRKKFTFFWSEICFWKFSRKVLANFCYSAVFGPRWESRRANQSHLLSTQWSKKFSNISILHTLSQCHLRWNKIKFSAFP